MALHKSAPGQSAGATEPGAGLALPVLLAWLSLVGSATWLMILQPASAQFAGADDPKLAQQIEQWVRNQEIAIPRHATLMLMPASRCQCASAPQADYAALVEHAAGRGAAVIEVSAQQADSAPFALELLLLGSDGRVQYAGPLHNAIFCSAGSTLADVAMTGGIPALVLPSDCSCDASRLRSKTSTGPHAANHTVTSIRVPRSMA